MSLFQRSKTQNKIIKYMIQHNYHRMLWTGQRYQGYVNYFNADQLFGFVVRDDAPEKEYYFHATDLQTDGVPRVRPYQNVEFSIHEGRGSNFIARDVSDYEGNQLQFYHANMRLAQEHRNKKLSDMPNGEHERHTGVIISLYPDGNGGLIVPDRLNFDSVQFRIDELQTTGVQRIDRFSEVEFYARKAHKDAKNQRDIARCITRKNGALITAERRERGSDRRRLGAMYLPNDTKARIPNEYSLNRELGYILDYNPNTLFGFIVPFNSPHNPLFVHIDDCHIFGKRILRRYMEVEFIRIKDDTNEREKALHVSGKNKTILRPVSENYYLTGELTTNKLELSDPNNNDLPRHKGQVIRVPPNNGGQNYIIIKPNDMGYQPVIGFMGAVKSLNRKDLKFLDEIEFSVTTNDKNDAENNNPLLTAYNITAGGNKPIIGGIRDLGRYLNSKINCDTELSKLDEHDNTQNGTKIKGFIASYNRFRKSGTIEIECLQNNKRYRKCLFDISDANLDSDTDTEISVPLQGQKIEFELVNNDRPMLDRDGNVIENLPITKRAININSITIANNIENIEKYLFMVIPDKRTDDNALNDDTNDDNHSDKKMDDIEDDREELLI